MMAMHKDYILRVQNKEFVCHFIGEYVKRGIIEQLPEKVFDFGNEELNSRIDNIADLLKDKNYGKEKNTNLLNG